MKRRLFCSIFFLLMNAAQIPAQPQFSPERDSLIRSYVQNNASVFDIHPDGGFRYPLLDSAAKKYQVFFAGESHDHAGITELKWSLLQYFYENAGVRVLMSEDPAAECWLLDQAMQKGDRDAYDRVASYLSNKAEDLVFYSRLYAFNERKPGDLKIRIFGTELEKSPGYIELALDQLFSEHGIPQNLIDHYERSKYDSTYHLRARLYREICHGDRPDGVSEAHWIMLRVLLRQYTVAYNFWDDAMPTEEMVPRENIMYRNAVDLFDLFPGAHVFAQYGSFHICRKDSAEWYDVKPWTSIAAQLEHDSISPVKGKVCNIDYLFTDQWYGRERLPDRRALVTLRQYRRGDFTLVKLDGMNQPFGSIPEKLNYAIIGDYDIFDERRYYKTGGAAGSDVELIRRHSFGLTGAWTGGEGQRFSVGICYMNRTLHTLAMPLAIGAEWENKFEVQGGVSGHFHAYHVFVNAVAFRYLSAGISAAAQTNYREVIPTLRPEAGLAWRGIRLLYAYEIPLSQIDPFLVSPAHLLRFRCFLPVYNRN